MNPDEIKKLIADSLAGLAKPDDVQKLIAEALANQQKGLPAMIAKAAAEAVKKAQPPTKEGEENTDPPPPNPAAPGDVAKLTAELASERKKREQQEKKLNELIEENRSSKELAEKTERFSALKSALAAAGVTKVDLAFRAIKDDVVRGDDGKIYYRDADGNDTALDAGVKAFVKANPEFQPPRTSGGSGGQPGGGAPLPAGGNVDLDAIKPGMKPEDLERARQETVRALQGALTQ